MLLISCTNEVENYIVYKDTLNNHVLLESYIDELSDEINLGEIQDIIKNEEKVKILNTGIVYSSYSPDTNCFTDSESCKDLVITITVRTGDSVVLNNQVKNKIIKYLGKKVSDKAHNK